jgi:hypothetical protein
MNKIEIVLASSDFGQIIECDTEVTLRAATRSEYERTVASWDAGSYGIIGVDHDGSLRRCYVHRPMTQGELAQAQASAEPSRARYERNTADQRMRNMAGMG